MGKLDVPELASITFPSVRIAFFGRRSAASGWIDFDCELGAEGIKPLFQKLAWSVPGRENVLGKMDRELRAGELGRLTLTPDPEKLNVRSKDGGIYMDYVLEAPYHRIGNFVCQRYGELREAGYARVLRFRATFRNEDGATEAERYMLHTGNARGALKVHYLREPMQTANPELKVTEGAPA